MDRLSPALEDYLETIAKIDQGEGVRITDIAEALGVAKPSASKAILTLKEKLLVTQNHYGPVKLTAEGQIEAAIVIKKHATVKFFLQGFLGIDESTAEQDACLIEHALSPQTLSSLLEFLDSNSAMLDLKKENNS